MKWTSIGPWTIATLILCTGSPGPVRAAPEKADQGNRGTLKLPGTVLAGAETRLYAGVAGTVKTVLVDFGDVVKKDQVLVQLAVPDVDAAMAEKQARVAQAAAEVERDRRGLGVAEAALRLASAQVQEAKAALKRSQAELDYRKATHQRYVGLARDKAITEEIVAEKLRQVEAAQAAVAEAQAKVATALAAQDRFAVKRAMARSDVKVAETGLEVAKANLRRVRILREFAQVRAPFDGIISRRSVYPGDLVGPTGRARGDGLVVVTRVDTVRVMVQVPDAAAAGVRPGQRAFIRFPLFKGREWIAKVSRTAGVLDPVKRTLRVEIDLANAEGKLLPGMSVEVTLPMTGPRGPSKE